MIFVYVMSEYVETLNEVFEALSKWGTMYREKMSIQKGKPR
jgi:DNA-binding HxlR family transcriptional regulator